MEDKIDRIIELLEQLVDSREEKHKDSTNDYVEKFMTKEDIIKAVKKK